MATKKKTLPVSYFYMYPNKKVTLSLGCSITTARGKPYYMFQPPEGCATFSVRKSNFVDFVDEVTHYSNLFEVELPPMFGKVEDFKLPKVKITDVAAKVRVIFPSLAGGDRTFRFQFDKDDVPSFNDAIQNIIRLTEAGKEAMKLVRMMRDSLD